MNATQLTNGTKIVTTTGNKYTVMSVVDNIVKVYEGQGMVHISKVNRIVRQTITNRKGAPTFDSMSAPTPPTTD